MFMDYDSAMSCDKKGSCSQNRMSDRRCGDSDCGTQRNYGCTGKHSWGLENHPLAMVYSPLQSFNNLLDVETALSRGTMFCELDLPFRGDSVYNSGKGGNCCG